MRWHQDPFLRLVGGCVVAAGLYVLSAYVSADSPNLGAQIGGLAVAVALFVRAPIDAVRSRQEFRRSSLPPER